MDEAKFVKDHIVEGDPNSLLIRRLDEKGAGGAYHVYEICKQYDADGSPDGNEYLSFLFFQNGPIAEAGINGLTQEVLLAVVIDRLRHFQAGLYPCDENQAALAYAEQSLHWLKERTRRRLNAQIEGQNKETPTDGQVQNEST